MYTHVQASAANRKRAVRSTWSIGMNKALAQNVSHEKVRLFGEAFAKIQEATGKVATAAYSTVTLITAALRLAGSTVQLARATAAAGVT
jgi:hypothetical protein